MPGLSAATPPVRIAMWSGPRNISTAMMRAWENRGDTAVWDEPFYAYYLDATGIEHPLDAEVIAAGETDWRRVVERLLGGVPDGHPVFFQKHMTHHLLSEIDRGWMDAVVNCFLIRDPREVLASYARMRSTVTVEDVGVLQQAEIFDFVEARRGAPPLVVDARDVLENPHGVLGALCAGVGVEFTERMLAWAPGPRASDGVGPALVSLGASHERVPAVRPQGAPAAREAGAARPRVRAALPRLWERRLRA